MMFEVKAWVVPTAKMKSYLATWSYQDRVTAASTTKAFLSVVKIVKSAMKDDKHLRYAIKRGGLNIRVACIGKEMRTRGSSDKIRNKKSASRRVRNTKVR